MKHGKKPTVDQKKILAAAGLDWREWLIVKSLPDVLVIQHRETGASRVIERS
ncbi:MAG: hypothetical protein J6M06_01110 [Synergistaceae bacterium]|nr:hypothetical protein [Synergistaceae bacterium]